MGIKKFLFFTLIFSLITFGLYIKIFSREKQTSFNITPQDLFEAAENGNSEAQYIVGLIYNKEESFSQAAEWYRKAAMQGHAKAQFNLANKYYEGNGVRQNFKEAFKWYQKAAEQGHSQAQFNLGCMYGRGEGVKKDFAQANQWLYKAALQGNIDAQKLLKKFSEK